MFVRTALFRDRQDAGQKLAEQLMEFKQQAQAGNCVVLALPRGGVPVAFEVAKALMAPLDLLMVSKYSSKLLAFFLFINV
jgi:putative phosphoribosyl transferase